MVLAVFLVKNLTKLMMEKKSNKKETSFQGLQQGTVHDSTTCGRCNKKVHYNWASANVEL